MQRAWRRDRQRYRDNYLKEHGPCVNCKEDDVFKLQVHFVDIAFREEHKIWYWAEWRRDSTLQKCSVICKACHKAFHRERDPLPEHGTLKRYKHPRQPCKCIKCRRANREYEAERAERKMRNREKTSIDVEDDDE